MRGRPKYKDPKEVRDIEFKLRLNEKEYQELEQFSKETGISKASIVRKAVHYFYAQKGQ